jgi:hypothetical protein
LVKQQAGETRDSVSKRDLEIGSSKAMRTRVPESWLEGWDGRWVPTKNRRAGWTGLIRDWATWQDELNNMVETQQSELRRKWGIEKSSLESSAQTAVVPEDTIDKLAKELGEAGL